MMLPASASIAQWARLDIVYVGNDVIDFKVTAELPRTLAADLAPERPGSREPRAVKRRPKAYPLLNKSRHQYRDKCHLNHCV